MEIALTLSPSSPNVVSSTDGNLKSDNDKRAKIALLERIKHAHQKRTQKIARKRRHSVAEDTAVAQSNEAKHPAAKHRRQYSAYTKKSNAGDIILPTNFLLGGNIRDPLNLNSLLDENVNKALNAVTPSSSPLPPRSSKINVVIPNDMTDPLGLNLSQTIDQSENDDNHVSPANFSKQNQKKRKKRRKSQHEKLFANASIDLQSQKEPSANITSSQKENVKVPKGKKFVGKLLDIEQDSAHLSAEKNQKQLSIAVPKTSSSIVDPVVSPVVPQDMKRSSAIFSPKSRKRKSLSQSSNKQASRSNNNNETLADADSRCEKSKSETPLKNRYDEKLFAEIKEARLQSNIKSKITFPEEQKTHNSSNNPNKKAGRSLNFKPANSKFQYGNYTKYYGYRNPQKFKDDRMECLKKEWFKDKDVLDVGCNVGHLTLLIARDFSPRKIVGVDIDQNLIQSARKNVRHYATAETKPPSKMTKYPESMPDLYGPIIGPPIESAKDDKVNFPNNIIFFQGNYVPLKEEVVQCQEPEYDVIMCMSVTKWMHLNWGDEGLTKTFKRMYKQLRPGGKLILEPQEWKSYAKKKSRLTETIYNNFYAIKIKPDSFPRYLIEEVGFEKVEFLKTSETKNKKGFHRPIQLYHKPE